MAGRTTKLKRLVRILGLQKSVAQIDLNAATSEISRIDRIKQEILEKDGGVFTAMLGGQSVKLAYDSIVTRERVSREAERRATEELTKLNQRLKGLERALQKAEGNEVESDRKNQFEELSQVRPSSDLSKT